MGVGTTSQELRSNPFGFASGFSCKSVSKLQNDANLKKAILDRIQDHHVTLHFRHSTGDQCGLQVGHNLDHFGNPH